jgi:hypothetical protein
MRAPVREAVALGQPQITLDPRSAERRYGENRLLRIGRDDGHAGPVAPTLRLGGRRGFTDQALQRSRLDRAPRHRGHDQYPALAAPQLADSPVKRSLHLRRRIEQPKIGQPVEGDRRLRHICGTDRPGTEADEQYQSK